MNKNYIKYLSGIINEEQFYFAESDGESDGPIKKEEKDILKEFISYAKKIVAIFELHRDEMREIYLSPKALSYFSKNNGYGYRGEFSPVIDSLRRAIQEVLEAFDIGHNAGAGGPLDVIALFKKHLIELEPAVRNGKQSLLVRAIDASVEEAKKDTTRVNDTRYYDRFMEEIYSLDLAIQKAQEYLFKLSIW